ncbi:hypothetical protein [Frankia sp. R82]|uniref:hypothetical protein n=1 Tax=Frankia sp. R82 TaxID=2950553 RepID=UPI0020446A02|nr:hypothetical protein [Frankia sp. R82]MCM3887418.1 hypothetical protein [Frankia sp. R82]
MSAVRVSGTHTGHIGSGPDVGLDRPTSASHPADAASTSSGGRPMAAPTELPGTGRTLESLPPESHPAEVLPLEASDADAAEQAREVRPPDSGATVVDALSEVDEFDRVEQSIVVETDEDDYR